MSKINMDSMDETILKKLEAKNIDLSGLKTEDKSSLVAAINEIFGKDKIATAFGSPLNPRDTWDGMVGKITGVEDKFRNVLVSKGIDVTGAVDINKLVDKTNELSKAPTFSKDVFKNDIGVYDIPFNEILNNNGITQYTRSNMTMCTGAKGSYNIYLRHISTSNPSYTNGFLLKYNIKSKETEIYYQNNTNRVKEKMVFVNDIVFMAGNGKKFDVKLKTETNITMKPGSGDMPLYIKKMNDNMIHVVYSAGSNSNPQPLYGYDIATNTQTNIASGISNSNNMGNLTGIRPYSLTTAYTQCGYVYGPSNNDNMSKKGFAKVDISTNTKTQIDVSSLEDVDSQIMMTYGKYLLFLNLRYYYRRYSSSGDPTITYKPFLYAFNTETETFTKVNIPRNLFNYNDLMESFENDDIGIMFTEDQLLTLDLSNILK